MKHAQSCVITIAMLHYSKLQLWTIIMDNLFLILLVLTKIETALRKLLGPFKNSFAARW